jgi:hypothetical protein
MGHRWPSFSPLCAPAAKKREHDLRRVQHLIFGLPNRHGINNAFSANMMAAGMQRPCVMNPPSRCYRPAENKLKGRSRPQALSCQTTLMMRHSDVLVWDRNQAALAGGNEAIRQPTPNRRRWWR